MTRLAFLKSLALALVGVLTGRNLVHPPQAVAPGDGLLSMVVVDSTPNGEQPLIFSLQASDGGPWQILDAGWQTFTVAMLPGP